MLCLGIILNSKYTELPPAIFPKISKFFFAPCLFWTLQGLFCFCFFWGGVVLFNIYLAGPGLSCGTLDLSSLLQHVGSSSLAKDPTWALCIESMGS